MREIEVSVYRVTDDPIPMPYRWKIFLPSEASGIVDLEGMAVSEEEAVQDAKEKFERLLRDRVTRLNTSRKFVIEVDDGY